MVHSSFTSPELGNKHARRHPRLSHRSQSLLNDRLTIRRVAAPVLTVRRKMQRVMKPVRYKTLLMFIITMDVRERAVAEFLDPRFGEPITGADPP